MEVKDTTSIASLIDHTLLKPEANESQLRQLCREAIENEFATVCVKPEHVKLASELVKGSGVKTITVIGFPSGRSEKGKVNEVIQALNDGAEELDMVIDIAALKNKDYRVVFFDIAAVVKAAQGLTVKVIIETSELSHEEKVIACALTKAAGAHYVKTSTGFTSKGATVEDVKLMRAVVGDGFGVKASGGIKTLDDAKAMIAAGANRLGTSNGVSIVSGDFHSSNTTGIY